MSMLPETLAEVAEGTPGRRLLPSAAWECQIPGCVMLRFVSPGGLVTTEAHVHPDDDEMEGWTMADYIKVALDKIDGFNSIEDDDDEIDP